MTMSQTSTNPALKWILIVIAVVTALGAVAVVLLSTYPADEYRVARELRKRGFDIIYYRQDGDKIWYRPTNVLGQYQSITSDDCRLFCQLPRLYYLLFMRCDMSALNLDEIGNCREVHVLQCNDATQFPVSELTKLTACPFWTIYVESKDVPLKDSDLEEFVKFTHLEELSLICNNVGVTDVCLEYFEKIPSLKKLRLPGASITQEGVEEFKKKRPDVEVYYE